MSLMSRVRAVFKKRPGGYSHQGRSIRIGAPPFSCAKHTSAFGLGDVPSRSAPFA